MTSARPSIDDIRKAHTRIADLAHRTPLTLSPRLSTMCDAEVKLKLETSQDTRSFKLRGAANVILAGRPRIDPARGVVTYSTGNHGRAVAHVAARIGVPATVCMSSNTTGDKRSALRQAGAQLQVVGTSQDQAAERARDLTSRGWFLVDPIDDPATIAGHGTIGIELLEAWPEVDTVVVPVSGGALISGIALALEALGNVRVVGVSMARGAAMHRSLQAGAPVRVDEVESLADSLQGGVGPMTFEIVRNLVDDLVLVTEEEIGIAVAHSVITERMILEGAAATTIAALLFRDRSLFGERIALIASGAVIAPNTLTAALEAHAAAAEALNREAVDGR
jgi:threonine dehydratase